MSLYQHSEAFIQYVEEFVRDLKSVAWDDVLADPQRMAVFAVDLINGFCYEGNLASPRIARIVAPTARLFTQAHERGMRQFVLIQEWHHEDAEEFKAFAPHGIRHTQEAQMVPELAALPFAELFTVMRKNSVDPAADTALDAWLAAHPLDTAIVVGDCTDICVFLLAMHLRTRANALNQPLRVMVPANCVDTYDLSIDAARRIGALPHNAELLHSLFLYDLALHNVEIVQAFIE